MAPLSDYTLLPGENGRVWQISNRGEVAKAQKDGLQYLIKMYARYPISPESTLDYDGDIEKCQRVYNRIKTVYKALEAVDAGNNCIAYATEVINQRSGEDAGVMDVVPFVAGGKDLVQYSGSRNARLDLLQSVADAVQLIHSVNVRHGDLKLENTLFVKHFRGEKAVIIDFDHSFMEGDVPDGFNIGGTDGYHSPEVQEYINLYDENEMYFLSVSSKASGGKMDAKAIALASQDSNCKKRITRKSDIYSLGVLFYLFLTNKWPYDSSGNIDVNPAELDNKKYLVELITAMLENNPEDRPDAEIVAESLRAKRFVTNLSPFQEVWPEHKGYQYQLSVAGRTITRIRRKEIDGEKMYTVTFEGYPPRQYTFNMMRNLGILKQNAQQEELITVEETEALWPDDEKNYRINTDMLKKHGFVKMIRCQKERMGRTINEYALIKSDGYKITKSVQMAIIQGFLVKK